MIKIFSVYQEKLAFQWHIHENRHSETQQSNQSLSFESIMQGASSSTSQYRNRGRRDGNCPPITATDTETWRFQSRPSVSYVSRCPRRIDSAIGHPSTDNWTSGTDTEFSSTWNRIRDFRQTWRHPKNVSQYADLRHT